MGWILPNVMSFPHEPFHTLLDNFGIATAQNGLKGRCLTASAQRMYPQNITIEDHSLFLLVFFFLSFLICYFEGQTPASGSDH